MGECRIDMGGSGLDQALSVRQTFDGGYIVAGSTTSTNGDVTVFFGSNDYWVLKLNDTGGLQWRRKSWLSGSGRRNCQRRLRRQTSDSGYIAVGWSDSNDGEVTGNQAVWSRMRTG